MKAHTFIRAADRAAAIISSAADWETKYDLIFSDDIAGLIRATGIEVDYYDPDTTYEEDVTAYVEAVRAKAARLRKALGKQS